MSPEIERCQHCGLFHPSNNLEEIAKYCMAVKKIEYSPYMYDHGSVVSHSGIKSIEYFDLDQQRKIFEEAARVNR